MKKRRRLMRGTRPSSSTAWGMPASSSGSSCSGPPAARCSTPRYSPGRPRCRPRSPPRPMGKSATLPLYVWLPDAMEGPTPVSALIHAATMVTAGVYMVARSSPLYSLAPPTLELVATLGALTALFAATIACVQTDIKRVIAYSTISQLGYMFLGAGVGAYASGIFHLATHAFFKALLFLGAGAVIHALHGEQDLQRMGGLRRPLKLTAYPFLIGAAANAGVFPLAGFWSKDEILFAAFTTGHYGLL